MFPPRLREVDDLFHSVFPAFQGQEGDGLLPRRLSYLTSPALPEPTPARSLSRHRSKTGSFQAYWFIVIHCRIRSSTLVSLHAVFGAAADSSADSSPGSAS